MLIFKNKGMRYDEYLAISELVLLSLNKYPSNDRKQTISTECMECVEKLTFPLFTYSDGWDEITVRVAQLPRTEIIGEKIPVSEHIINRSFPSEMIRVLSAYPKAIQSIVFNASNFYHAAKRSWGYLDGFNTKNEFEINSLILQDYRLLAALLYNVSVRRYTDGVRGSRDGYLYSSVPIYDGREWEKIKIAPNFIKELIRLQGKGFALETNLELFVHVPRDTTR